MEAKEPTKAQEKDRVVKHQWGNIRDIWGSKRCSQCGIITILPNIADREGCYPPIALKASKGVK